MKLINWLSEILPETYTEIFQLQTEIIIIYVVTCNISICLSILCNSDGKFIKYTQFQQINENM